MKGRIAKRKPYQHEPLFSRCPPNERFLLPKKQNCWTVSRKTKLSDITEKSTRTRESETNPKRLTQEKKRKKINPRNYENKIR